METILGLDLGTNSIGWALVEIDHERRIVRIVGLGSRILQMNAGEVSTYESGGQLKSDAAERSAYRSVRKMNERFLLRRDRLHCVLNMLSMLPEHYKLEIEFENEKGKRSGKFKKGSEVKLAYTKDEKGKRQFLFMDAYYEMIRDLKDKQPSLFYKNKKGKTTKIPYDWTFFYLRKKALTQKITKEELAWITLGFNQKRGYQKILGVDEKLQKEGELSEVKVGKVQMVNYEGTTSDGQNIYKISLVDKDDDSLLFSYFEEANTKITQIDDLKQLEIVSKLDEDGNITSTVYYINELINVEITEVKNTYKKIKDNFVYEVSLSCGWKKEERSKVYPKWKNTFRDFIVKTKYNEDGRIKTRTLDTPSDSDWEIIKLKAETKIQEYNISNHVIGVASYIYNSLVKNPQQKINGDLITVIERKYYQDELNAIFDKQKEYHEELNNAVLYQKALNLLYPHNIDHVNTLKDKDFKKLISDDIIFYQRDLKTKKSLIANCPYEVEKYEYTSKDGKKCKKPLKAIHKANPYYQEFRLWQFIKHLRIVKLEKKEDGKPLLLNQDVTNDILDLSKKEVLFEYLNDRNEITQKSLFKFLNISDSDYRWNFEENHKEPCNETRYNFILRLKRIKQFPWNIFLSAKDKKGCLNEYLLWHFFYSVKKESEVRSGLISLIPKLLKNANIDSKYTQDIFKNLSSFSGYNNDYGSYSEKAIKKLLLFMRIGKFWNKNDAEILLNNSNHEIKDNVLNKENVNGEIEDFQGLGVSSSCYLVYGRYSEVGDVQYWKQPKDIASFLENDFAKQSLNNPVVEKVLRETLQVVKDLWIKYGEYKEIVLNGKEERVYQPLYSNIHIELARELKKNAQQKKKLSIINTENKRTNERIIKLLKELKTEYGNSLVNEKSPFQQEKLRLIEIDLLSSIEKDKDTKLYDYKDKKGTIQSITKKEISVISQKNVEEITKAEIERYRLWLDQRYQSPYTGKLISLSNLFDKTKYQVEHIFPRERITLNAMCNKVICETEVNLAKGSMTGYEFIQKQKGRRIKCQAFGGQEIILLSPSEYESKVKELFTDKEKQNILLSRDIPEKFTNSQLNNTQYIAKMAMKLLSNIVREEGETAYKSKNVLAVSGAVTTSLKKDWQLDEAWNSLISPRFKRLNKLTDSTLFGSERNINGHNFFIPTVPEQLNSNFEKKRIDHRHHALDALIIALATETQVNYINNINASDSGNDGLANRKAIRVKYMAKKANENGEKDRVFLPPVQYKMNKEDGEDVVKYKYMYQKGPIKDVFKDVALEALQNTLVSFKQKNRIIRQRMNYIKLWDEDDKAFKIEKEKCLEEKTKYNVRQSLHKDTFYGFRKIQPLKIDDAINNNECIVENRIKNEILRLKGANKTKNEIIAEIKKTDEVVYVQKDCVTTQWNNTLNSFASISSDKIIDTINKVADIAIQRILKIHLHEFDSISVTVPEAKKTVDDIVYDDQKKAIRELLLSGKDTTEIMIGNKVIKKIDVFIRNRDISKSEEIKVKCNPQVAFSCDGIYELNANILKLNGGKSHKPIFKVQMAQVVGNMFPVSENINSPKSKRYVSTKEGSNMFCAIYQSDDSTKIIVPTFKETIEYLRKNDTNLFPDEIVLNNLEFKRKIILSPLDMVYVPSEEEIEMPQLVDFTNLSIEQKNRIYKFVDGNSNEVMNFIPYYISNPIVNISKEQYKEINLANLKFSERKLTKKGVVEKKKEMVNEIGLGSTQSKNQNSFEDDYLHCVQIKTVCWFLKVDRLGNIIALNRSCY